MNPVAPLISKLTTDQPHYIQVCAQFHLHRPRSVGSTAVNIFVPFSEESLFGSRFSGKLTTADGLYMETVCPKFQPDRLR